MKEMTRAVVRICSLKEQELKSLSSLFQELQLNFEVEVQTQTLLKSQLRGFQCDFQADLVVLHHRSEGRLFLTDRNGFYNDFLASAYREHKGRVLIILTNVKADPPEGALVASEVYEVAKHGDQPTIGTLGKLGKVLCFAKTPSAYQLNYLVQVLQRSAFYKEPPVYAGLPGNFHVSPESSHFKCQLL